MTLSVEDLERGIKARTPEQQIAIFLVRENAANGSVWGVASKKEIQDNLEIIKKSSNFRLIRLGEDKVLFEVAPEFFMSALDPIDVDFANTYRNSYKQAKLKAIESFKKRFKSFVGDLKKGQTKHIIGVYSVNSVQYATSQRVKDGEPVRVNAYQLNLDQLSTLVAELCNEYGVRAIIRVTNDVVLTPGQKTPNPLTLKEPLLCRDDNALEVMIELQH